MSALDELHAERPDRDFVALLQRTIGAVARGRGFPPPEGCDRWDAEAIESTVHEFFAHSQTPRRLKDLAMRCRTDDVLRAELHTTVRHFLADIGRTTPVGRLVLRINEVLKRDPGFERREPYWALTGTNHAAAAVDLDALVAAIAEIEVVVPSAWMTGDRQSPEIDGPSTVRVSTALLENAGGPLTSSVMAQATAKRLGLDRAPLSLDATAFDPPTSMSGLHDITGDESIRELRAQEILELLNDVERVAIGHTVAGAALAAVIGVSGSSAALIRTRASSIVQQALGSDPDRDAVGATVAELARSWTESWMTNTDPTYSSQ